MIVLTVLSYNGARAEGPTCQLDELGGTIGRADNNQLVLPDPERSISRVHARVVYRAGRYAIVDNGSNPISVNGVTVDAGREHPLSPGDKVEIGGYLIEASDATTAAASDDPFADLFGDAPIGLAAPAPPPSLARPGATSMPAVARTPPPAPKAPMAPMASWPSPPAFAPSPPSAPRSAPAAALGAGHIPVDWDPFAADVDHAAAPLGGAPTSAASAAAFDLPLAGGDSLDDLFGLSGVAPAGDPLAAPRASQAPPLSPGRNGADPLAAIMRTATVMPASRSDHVSELNTPMSLPQVARAAPQPSVLPPGAVFSWDDPPPEGRQVTLPGVQLGRSLPPSSPQMPLPAARPAPMPAAAPTSDEGAMLAALLEGLDAPGLKMAPLTPESMRVLGQLLRESMRGTVELLVARAALKREMRAELTMIAQRENNPLKFSPTVEVALAHLLGPPTKGFLPAVPAIKDAFDDLRAHQLGVMAGMRAALEGVLQRFNPQQLESKLTRGSALSNLIPATRKARLWELFNELFAQLQTEAQDDFDEIFGKAFLRAYEDQLDRLHGEAGNR